MGMTIEVPRAPETLSIKSLLGALTASGLPTTVMMIDGQLVMPGTEPAPTWRDIRLRTPAGTVTLARREGAIAVVVFGNADAAAQQAQQRIADALRE
jgi:hypothetical protein